MKHVLNGPVILAGAGKMGSALLTQLVARGLSPQQIHVQEPYPSKSIVHFSSEYGILVAPQIGPLVSSPSVIILAVKPQDMENVFPSLSLLAGPETVILSIAAGRTVASFEKRLPPNTSVVRAMPNTPAQVGSGITACIANSATTLTQRTLATEILSSLGEVVWLDRELDMDVVTAISGSGPAYVFYFVECLTQAGISAGLSPEVAARLARATVIGAGELLRQSKSDVETLRENVTSPGGTTAAALKVLTKVRGLQDLLIQAIDAAVQRSRDLSK